jgi:hypothetical protein
MAYRLHVLAAELGREDEPRQPRSTAVRRIVDAATIAALIAAGALLLLVLRRL